MCEVDLSFWLSLLSLKVMTYFSTNLDPLFLTNLELLFYLLNSFDQVVHLLQGQWPPSWSLTKCFCRWSKACVSVVLWVIPALGISNTPVASYYNNIMYKLSYCFLYTELGPQVDLWVTRVLWWPWPYAIMSLILQLQMMSKMGGLGGMDNPMGVSVNPDPCIIHCCINYSSKCISSFFSTFPVPAKKKSCILTPSFKTACLKNLKIMNILSFFCAIA